MEILICIDDTDDLTKATSTGKIAGEIEARLLECGVIHRTFGITRHQLLLDERIRYTSHNSSMCLGTARNEDMKSLPEEKVQKIEKEIIDVCIETILALKAGESDPGLCVCFPEKILRKDRLIAFGLMGQNQVLTKEMAYRLAEEESIYLSEHGGDGAGVIGALCSVGLRLSGFDGWFRGKIKPEKFGIEGELISAGELMGKTGIPVLHNEMRRHEDEMIDISDGIKCLLWNHQKMIVVHKEEGNNAYKVLKKNQLKNAALFQASACGEFAYDNDAEERRGSDQDEKSCFNCLYRRWTKQNFECVKEKIDAVSNETAWG